MIPYACKLCALMLVAVCLAACSTNEREYVDYVEPTGLDAQSVATLTGSTIQQPGFFESDYYAYVIAIDGKIRQVGYKSWNDRIKVLSGFRKIYVSVSLGGEINGDKEFQLELDADRIYSVHSTLPEFDWAAWKWKTSIWIEDQDGTVLTEKSIVEMEMRVPNSVIFIPS